MTRPRVFVLLLALLMNACSEDEIVNEPPLAAFTVADGIDRIVLDAKGTHDDDGDQLTFTWNSTVGNIAFDNSQDQLTSFQIPLGFEEFQATITLQVSDGFNEVTATQLVTVPKLTDVRAFGIGKNSTKEVTNDRPYAWYIDQSTTGTHALINCGPTSVTMALKWVDENFAATAEDARNTYKPDGGWWYTYDIINYLNKYSVLNWTIELADMDVMREEIDNGNIVLLCLDMFHVKYNTVPEYHVDKFYPVNGNGWGHFIVVKGYKEVDGQLFFEVYDPYTMGNTYKDLTPKGKDRYYSAYNLDVATEIWWDYAIVVSKDASTEGRRSVNVDRIKHMPGR
jgi:hypothetical protein